MGRVLTRKYLSGQYGNIGNFYALQLKHLYSLDRSLQSVLLLTPTPLFLFRVYHIHANKWHLPNVATPQSSWISPVGGVEGGVGQKI